MIYLDSAATTMQKPPAVSAAVSRAFRELSSPGRGGYPSAMRAADLLLDCRTELHQLFHTESPEQVVFTTNATHGLNIAIKSLVPPGGKAIISGYEHNSVTRPLNALHAQTVIISAPLYQPKKMLAGFERALRDGADAVICTQVSNVFGYALPITELAALCRVRRIPMVVDASQAAGVLPLDMTELGIAYAAMPGHKSLYGPQGTGVLLCGSHAQPATLLEGGTGSLSRQPEMPDFLPDRLEAGTHNMPGIAGLLEGVRFVRSRGTDSIRTEEQHLTWLAAQELQKIPGIHVFCSESPQLQMGVFSFASEQLDAMTLGSELANSGIAVRAGLHCSPLAHQTAGTLETGTVRVSFSVFNTERDVHELIRQTRKILGEKS